MTRRSPYFGPDASRPDFAIEPVEGLDATRARFADRYVVVLRLGNSRVAIYFHQDMLNREDVHHVDLTPGEGNEACADWLEAERNN